MSLNQEKLIQMALSPNTDEWDRDDAIGDLAYFPDMKSIETLIEIINQDNIKVYYYDIAIETIIEIIKKNPSIQIVSLQNKLNQKTFDKISSQLKE